MNLNKQIPVEPVILCAGAMALTTYGIFGCVSFHNYYLDSGYTFERFPHPLAVSFILARIVNQAFALYGEMLILYMKLTKHLVLALPGRREVFYGVCFLWSLISLTGFVPFVAWFKKRGKVTDNDKGTKSIKARSTTESTCLECGTHLEAGVDECPTCGWTYFPKETESCQ